jgi:hypothetical protein
MGSVKDWLYWTLDLFADWLFHLPGPAFFAVIAAAVAIAVVLVGGIVALVFL